MTFKPIKPGAYYDNKIAREIINWEWNWYYKPILDILKTSSVANDDNALFDAIKSGTLYYQNGAFYSKTGRFSNRIAIELEKIGARYSKYGRCYRITKEKLPQQINWIIETTNAKVFSDVVVIKKTLDDFLGILGNALKGLKLQDVAESMILDIEKRANENMRNNKIEVVQPKMSDFIAKQFSEDYTDTIRFDIKDKLPEQIIKMREVVGQMAINGESKITIQKYIENNFVKDQKRAKFLARNESSIAVTEYLKAKYQENGSEEFKWIANLDERVRDDHRKLHGTVHRYDNPPIIDERTGTRGMPGEFYNCRCTFVPIFKKFNKQNNII